MWAKCSWYCPFKIPSFGEDPDIAVILGGLALKLGEAGVEAGVLRQDRGDQESNLQAKHLINSSHRGCGHIWLTPLGKAGVEGGVL